MLRSYRTCDGERLVEVGPARATGFPADDAPVTLDDGTSIEPRVFDLLDADGSEVAHYGHPHSHALDDYLYVHDVRFVRDGALCSGMLEMGGPTDRLRTRLSMVHVLLEGPKLE
jgi:hypothetical protein